ncbi:hypothetical protein AX774_g4858 [Zancudomyces culisetae]|uniref:TPR repeat-containing protein n=1 Tax=Zancudomyces culisetae TaxID=1213189 RepID=A0A1R1PL42_ZANCU|nr:hypothetical protein AX774_g4858 [Zancudomyces culisetae]|eukprot:OMH81684.1 hypothetical protein AX774_g4858 [Zancudomyces culisetae]
MLILALSFASALTCYVYGFNWYMSKTVDISEFVNSKDIDTLDPELVKLLRYAKYKKTVDPDPQASKEYLLSVIKALEDGPNSAKNNTMILAVYSELADCYSSMGEYKSSNSMLNKILTNSILNDSIAEDGVSSTALDSETTAATVGYLLLTLKALEKMAENNMSLSRFSQAKTNFASALQVLKSIQEKDNTVDLTIYKALITLSLGEIYTLLINSSADNDKSIDAKINREMFENAETCFKSVIKMANEHHTKSELGVSDSEGIEKAEKTPSLDSILDPGADSDSLLSKIKELLAPLNIKANLSKDKNSSGSSWDCVDSAAMLQLCHLYTKNPALSGSLDPSNILDLAYSSLQSSLNHNGSFYCDQCSISTLMLLGNFFSKASDPETLKKNKVLAVNYYSKSADLAKKLGLLTEQQSALEKIDALTKVL